MVELNISTGFQMFPNAMNDFPGAASQPQVELAPFCPEHAPKREENQGWAEKENGIQLPLVNMSLQLLGPKMKQVVKVCWQ